MRRIMIAVFILAFIVLTIAACGGKAANNPEMEQLLQDRCTTCHLLNYVERGIAKDSWPNLVDRMINWGAELNEDERDELVDYMQARYSK